MDVLYENECVKDSSACRMQRPAVREKAGKYGGPVVQITRTNQKTRQQISKQQQQIKTTQQQNRKQTTKY